MEVAVLCGGAGTRLKNILGDIPKILAPIGEHRFIDFLFEYLSQQSNVENVNWLLGVGASDVKHYIEQKNWKSSYKNNFIIDKKINSGNGSALVDFASKIKTENFICLFGDSLPMISLMSIYSFFQSESAKIGVTYISKDLVNEKPNIKKSKLDVISYSSEENFDFAYVDYGVTYFKTQYLLHPKFSELKDLKSIILKCSYDQELSGHEVFEPFVEIGTPISYNSAKTKLKVI